MLTTKVLVHERSQFIHSLSFIILTKEIKINECIQCFGYQIFLYLTLKLKSQELPNFVSFKRVVYCWIIKIFHFGEKLCALNKHFSKL